MGAQGEDSWHIDQIDQSTLFSTEIRSLRAFGGKHNSFVCEKHVETRRNAT
jgi:hypothetical protein